MSCHCLTYGKSFLMTVIFLPCQETIKWYINYSVIILLVDFGYSCRALYAFATDDSIVTAFDKLTSLTNLWHSEINGQIAVSILPSYNNPDLTIMLSRFDESRNPCCPVISLNSEEV